VERERQKKPLYTQIYFCNTCSLLHSCSMAQLLHVLLPLHLFLLRWLTTLSDFRLALLTCSVNNASVSSSIIQAQEGFVEQAIADWFNRLMSHSLTALFRSTTFCFSFFLLTFYFVVMLNVITVLRKNEIILCTTHSYNTFMCTVHYIKWHYEGTQQGC